MQTIIVSNRLPVSVKKTSKGLEFFQSSGGLVSAMENFKSKPGTIWIGWPGINSDNLTDSEMQKITKKLKSFNCLPVFLTKQQVDDYYSGYSNSVLWPLFHHLPADFDNENKFWRSYERVNELFADVVSSVSSQKSDIWIHDYQLMLLPKYIRNSARFERIGFFLHIPFPNFKHIAKLKNHLQLAQGLLNSDLVGFHTKNYAKEFLNLCDELNIGTATNNTIDLKTRAVLVTNFPIGIDYKKFANESRKYSVKRRARKLKSRYKKRKIIVTVDRLDPTKGFIERLKAYRKFLKTNPELHEKVVMIMLAIPSRSDVKAYKILKERTEKLVAEINSEFGTAKWQPIDYMYKSVDFKELSAMYSAADIAFITPIKDGMNLVAKEYIASQYNKKGVLILSETAGAALELKDALIVNPNRPQSLVDALEKALKMPSEELKKNIDKMQKTIAKNTNKNWADSFMNSLKSTDKLLTTVNLTKSRSKILQSNYQTSTKRLLAFDYDGVLSPFIDDPSMALPSKKIYTKIKNLASNELNDVAIISGRSKADLQKWFGDLPIILGAEHGSVLRISGKWQEPEKMESDWKLILKPTLEKFADSTPGAFVEEKQSSLVWHYRKASPYYAQKNITILKSALKPALNTYGLKLYMGSKIIEIKNQNINKGIALKKILAMKPYDFVLVVGDDYTDEDMFKVAKQKSNSIKVGHGRTEAKYRISGQSKIYDVLDLF